MKSENCANCAKRQSSRFKSHLGHNVNNIFGKTCVDDVCSYDLIRQIKSFNAGSSGQECHFRIKGFYF